MQLRELIQGEENQQTMFRKITMSCFLDFEQTDDFRYYVIF